MKYSKTSDTPSQYARELVSGSYDIHVHSGPDVVPRRINDVDLARRLGQVGMAGYVIKSHYVPTAERAAVVRAAVSEVDTVGSITLNSAIGGMNPLAVEIAAREGARFVWMPTVDALNEPAGRTPALPGAKLPGFARTQLELIALGIGCKVVEVVDAEGRILPETREVLRRIAAHDLVLATGHLGRDEIFAVVNAAVVEGVTRIVITHPDYPTQALSAEDQRELVQLGAVLERCFTPIYSGKISWETVCDRIRATGAEKSVLSSDLGQLNNPPVEDGLALMAERLLAEGFSEEEVHTMAVDNSRRLAKRSPTS